MFEHTVFSDRVEIHASAELVWQVLVDFERYSEWNPFTHRIDTDLVIGSSVELHVRLPGWGARRQTEYVEAVDRPQLLSWGMTMGGKRMLRALREQQLEKLSETRCVYQSTDAFSGFLTPLVWLLFGRSIRNGFNAMAWALKARAESLAE